MKIELTREALLSLINPLLAVSPKAGPFPILNSALIIAHSDGSVTAEGTNSTAWVRNKVECNVHEAGGFCIHVHRLNELIRALSAGITISLTNNQDKQHIQVAAGRCQYKLNILPQTDFPAPPSSIEKDGKITKLTLSEEALSAALSNCIYAMSKEGPMPQLNGITFDLSAEKSRLVATDGHRLAMTELPAIASLPLKCLIPVETIQYMQSKIGATTKDVEIAISDNNICIRHDNIQYQNCLKFVQTIDYESVLPKIQTNLIASRMDLIGALERSKIIAHDKLSVVLLRIDQNQIGFFANNNEEGDKSDNYVSAESKTDKLDISFNLHYLLDALRSINDETVHISIRGSHEPIVLTGTQEWSHINVLMPVRV